jgi:tetratricopeptide (TPR) repeat protein
MHYDFVAWDDDQHVYTNPHFQPVTWERIGTFWREPYARLYIPLTYTVWAAVVWLSQTLWPGPLTAALFHRLNLLLHLGNVLVVYRLGLLMLRRGEAVPERTVAMAAATGALLFGLHPLQVEAVAWVSGLKDVLCGWWALVAVWQYLECVTTPYGYRRVLHYSVATGAFGLALLAKPAAVVVPMLAWLLATVGLGQAHGAAMLRLMGWLSIAVVWSWWTKEQQPDAWMSYVPPWWGRPLVAADAIAFYLGKLVWPVHLAPDYGRSPLLVVGQGIGYVTGLVPVGLGAVLWWGKKWLGKIGLAVAVFVVGVFPVLGWVPFFFQGYSTVADRYVYLALVGPALGLSWGVCRLGRYRGTWMISGLVLALLGMLSAGQLQVWRDTVLLFTHALQVNPHSALAHDKLGTALAQQGRLDEAIPHYTAALRLSPNYATAHNNLGLMLAQQGQLDAAMAHYRRALQLKPDFLAAYSNLGWVLAQQGQLDEAISQYRAALQLNPEAAEVHYNLGNVLLRQGHLARAIVHYTQAVQLRPAWAEAHNNLGSALDDQGHVAEAIAHYQTALRLKPEFAEAYNNLGDAWLDQGRVAEASQAFRAALHFKPEWPEAHYNLGLALTQQGQLQEAIAAYRRALQLRPGWAQAADNLARLLVLQKDPLASEVLEECTYDCP